MLLLNNPQMNPLKIVFIICVVVSALYAWQKAGFKCPIYIHVLASVAIFLGFFIANGVEPSASINKWWLLGKWWIVPIMPALVYGTFIIRGRQIYSKDD
jgi:hypothetical protein